MVNAAIVGVWFWIVAAGTLFWLVRGKYTRPQDRIAWFGVVALLVGGLLSIVGTVGESAQGNDIAVFLATIAVCALVLGASIWFARSRHRAPAETEPESQAPRTNYIHAYGTYDSTTIKAARADAQRIRRGARA